MLTRNTERVSGEEREQKQLFQTHVQKIVILTVV
jgi:hypothetical protein